MNYRFLLLSVAVLLVVVAGCGDKVPLSGTVTFSDNGDPLPQGAVFFQSDKVLAQGAIQPDGKYTVGTDKMTDGLPRGSYRVYIAGSELLTYVQTRTGVTDHAGRNIDEQFRDEIVTHVIDRKYANPDTSGLTFEADGKEKTFNIQVDRYSGR